MILFVFNHHNFFSSLSLSLLWMCVFVSILRNNRERRMCVRRLKLHQRNYISFLRNNNSKRILTFWFIFFSRCSVFFRRRLQHHRCRHSFIKVCHAFLVDVRKKRISWHISNEYFPSSSPSSPCSWNKKVNSYDNWMCVYITIDMQTRWWSSRFGEVHGIPYWWEAERIHKLAFKNCRTISIIVKAMNKEKESIH
jgi:hypothetical protein